MLEHPETHERALQYAVALAPDLFQNSYVLFEEKNTGHYHGSSTCSTSPQKKVRLTVEEILALRSTGEECECGGWRSTEFFPALLIAHRSWELHRIADVGGIEDVGEALEQIERMQPWWRPDLENLGSGIAAAAALSRENYRMELDLLEAFTEKLDPAPLLRHIGAHGLRVENDVDGARELAAWADSLNPRHTGSRFSRSPLSFSARTALSREITRRADAQELFTAELDRALAGPRAAVMLERRLWSPVDGATWHTPAEVLLLSFCYENSPRSSFAWFEVPEVVVKGMYALLEAIPGPPRLGVLGSTRLPPSEVRLMTESLWSENAGTWQNLDEVLAAAIVLATDHAR